MRRSIRPCSPLRFSGRALGVEARTFGLLESRMDTSEKLPEWLVKWWHSSDTGMSSKYIAGVFSDIPAMRQTTEVAAPRDTSDVGRCVRLLDLATANGCDWRGRIGDLATGHGDRWAALVPRWSEVEAAYHEDVAAQNAHKQVCLIGKNGRKRRTPRNDVHFPPSRCWWLVATLASDYDPYKHSDPHPFRQTGLSK